MRIDNVATKFPSHGRIGRGIRDRAENLSNRNEMNGGSAQTRQAHPSRLPRDLRGIRLEVRSDYVFGGFKVAVIRIRYRARSTPIVPMAPMAPMAPISSLPLQIGVPTRSRARSFARIANI